MKAEVKGNLVADPKVTVREDGSQTIWFTVAEDVINPATGKQVDTDYWPVKVYSKDAMNPSVNATFAAGLKKGSWISMTGRYHRRSNDAGGYYEYFSPVEMSTFVSTKQRAA